MRTELQEEILKLHKEGLSPNDIGIRLLKKTDTIINNMEAMGLKVSTRGYEAHKPWRKDKSISDMNKRLDVEKINQGHDYVDYLKIDRDNEFLNIPICFLRINQPFSCSLVIITWSN